MYAVGRIGSYISRGVDTVAAPFHPFGGAVDMIVVQQVDGSLKSSPWYVRFGKFQGVLKTKEKVVNVTVNGVAAGFHMYLDHKGEAYFLNEVDGEEEEVGVYHSSSGEDTDKQARGKRLTKSEGFETEVKQPNSARLADGRDECKREFGAWSNSRRARILGLVFGSRSFKERMTQGSPEDEELKRARLLERAEIAADLLELKWSTTLATKKPKKNYALNSFLDEEISRERSLVSDKQEHDNDLCEPVNGTVIADSPKDIVGPPELMSEVKSPMKYSVFVAAEPSDSLEIPRTKENAEAIGEDLMSENPGKSNVILNPDSLIGIKLVTQDSVDTEMGEVIHPTDVVITRTDEDGNIKMEDAHVSGYFSRQNSSSSSCISEEEVVEPEVTTTIAGEEAAESNPGSIDHRHQIDSISDLDNSKLTAESTSLRSMSDSPSGESRSPQSNDLTYESFSSSDKSAQLKVANHLDEHAGIPDAVSPTQKSGHLSKSDNDISITDGAKLSEELRGDPISSSAGDMTSETWGIWPFSFKRSRSMKSSKSVSRSPRKSQSCSYPDGTSQEDSIDGKQKVNCTRKKVKTVIPTSQQLASLNLKEGRNEVTFTFSTAMLGDQQVDAKIYVWKWNARIVISDVDGTITRSDVLGQVMPLVGVDWSHIGVTQLFSAIKENGYHLLFLSARSISQAYHTRQFLFNLKQNGQALPEGPVVISPDGLFPSLFREVIRRAPHEFKIACLEDIKACFPPDCNPFYAGFGNRDTDEFSYLKVGIPKGKIFIINPKGEVAVHRRLDTKSYTSLHSLVNDIFPPTSTTEQEDFNSWNFWKLPPPTM